MFPGSYCVDQMQNAQRVYLSRDCSSSVATSLRQPRPLRVRGPSNRRRLLRQGVCVWSLSQDSDGLSLSSLEGTKYTTNEPVVSTAVGGPTAEVISPADAGAAVQDTLKSVTGTDTLLADIYHSLEGSGQPQPRRRHQQPDYVENLSEDATVTESKGSGSGLGAVLALAIPALGSVLADPLMSLVDTGCVGQVSSLQLAALGPNTAVFNLIFQVFAFLGVATTNVLATNSLHAPGISAEEQHRRKEVSQKMLCYALTIAAACGTAVACGLEVWGASLLTAVGTSAEMLPPALAYLRIRALASPAVMVMCVAQGACLGQQDAWTPLKVFAAAGVLNLVGDAYLILQAGMGITGAAVATSAAQYMGAAYFLWYLHRQGRRKGGVALKWHGLPKFETLQPFVGVAVTLLSRTAFTMAAFTSITAAATTMGTLSTAAHQVALQVFWFLSFVPEPLSMTAQSLIARDRTDPSKVRSMAYLLLKLGAMVGMGLGLAMAGIFYGCPWLFTSDATVMAAIMPLTAQGMLAIGFCSLTMMCDGVSIGSGDFAHLPRTNFVGMMVAGSTLYAMAQANAGLPGVWWALAAFFMARLAQHGLHAVMNWRASAFGQYQPGLLAAAA